MPAGRDAPAERAGRASSADGDTHQSSSGAVGRHDIGLNPTRVAKVEAQSKTDNKTGTRCADKYAILVNRLI